MNIRFDAHGLQWTAEQHSGERLSGPEGLLELLGGAGHTVGATLGPLNRDGLAGTDVLVITTRIESLARVELEVLAAFVQEGGGLWCLSNHGPFADHAPMSNVTLLDQPIASLFGLCFEPAAYERIDREPMWLPVQGVLAGCPGWPVVSGRDDNRVAHVVSNNSCAVLGTPEVIGSVPLAGDGVVDFRTQTPPPAQRWWAVCLDRGLAGRGRCVFCADSGWLGNDKSTVPGRGLLQHGDNRQLALNMVSWLTEDR